MLTPGSRLFFGYMLAGLVGMFVYGVASGDGGGVDYLGFVDAEAWLGAISLGWKGGIGDHVGYLLLLLFALTAGFIATVLVAYRDADPDAVAELAGGELPPPQGPTSPSYWPVVGAFGVGVLVIGLVTHAAIFVIGLILLTGTVFEWMMSAWADRATGDPAANKELRDRLMRPIEMPVLGALGIGAVILAISRILLTVSKEWAVWLAVIIASLIFLVAIAFSLVESWNRNLVAGVVVVGAIAVLAGGVVSAALGQREFEIHHGEEEHHDDEGEGEEGSALLQAPLAGAGAGS